MSELAGLRFDGRSSQAAPVRLQREGEVLRLVHDDGQVAEWPLAEVAISPRLGSTPRLLRRAGHGHVECTDSPLLDQWGLEPRGWVERAADWLERRRVAIAAAAAATVLATVGFVQYGVPAVAGVLAERMPRAVERAVSNQAVLVLERVHLRPSGLPPGRQAELRAAFARLVEGEPRHAELALHFTHAPRIGPNAFALPDGRIYMTDALVELAESDDELLAILAHEAGHHVHRHGMRQALESSSVFLLAGLMLGDVSGSSIAVSIPAALLQNGFSRGHEREADRYAFDLLLRRERSPEAFATVMERLASDAPAGPDGGYLSTHPPTPERIEAARAAAKPGPGRPR